MVFVLLIVLWWLALLVLIATQIITAMRIAVSISANIRSSAIAEAQADAGVNEAVFQVLARVWDADGAAHVVRGPQAVARVWVNDEGDRIDPNVAPALLIQALLRTCGAPPERAGTVANAIVEWRSVDLLRAAGPNTAPAYQAAGRDYLPPNKRFVSVDELGLVLGMTKDLLRCVEPHVTVYSLAVPSLRTTTDPLVRRALTEAYPYESARPIAAAVYQVAVVRITAVVQQPGGGQFRRVAVVRVASAEPDDAFTYKILAWE